MTPTNKASQIVDALFARAASLVTGSPTLPVSWPEQAETFEPPADGRYLEVMPPFKNVPAWEGVSDGEMSQGLLQINVVWPKNAGLLDAAEIAGLVMAHFAKGTLMTSGATTVKVGRQPWDSAPLVEPDRVFIPVTVPWTAAG
jgi:hypothetical protein